MNIPLTYYSPELKNNDFINSKQQAQDWLMFEFANQFAVGQFVKLPAAIAEMAGVPKTSEVETFYLGTFWAKPGSGDYVFQILG